MPKHDTKHILLHRPTPWDSNVHCSTKIYAKLFKRAGYKVSYLEDPLDILHLIKWKGYYHVWKKSPRWEDGVWIINPFSLVPRRDIHLLKTQTAANLNYLTCLPSLRRLLFKSGQGMPDIIWTTKPGSKVLKNIFPEAKFIFHVVDYYPAFRGDYIKELEKQDYDCAEQIFTIGHSLSHYLSKELFIPEKKINVLGQGVACDLYADAMPHKELDCLPRPRAVWVGVLNKGDKSLFSAAAEALKSAGGCLVLVGPEADWVAELQAAYKNIFFMGSRNFEEIPSILVSCDIGLMLYDRRKKSVYYGQNPLKLYEYAAAGLSIISTSHEEYSYLRPPVLLVESELEVKKAIQKALDENVVYKQEALAFAEQHSWSNCFSIIEDALQRI